MAEIPQSFFQGRSPEAGRVTGGIPSVPGTARLQGSELLAEAGVQLGRQGQGIGGQLFDVARRREAEREAIQSTRGVASGLIEIEALNARIQNDASIEPLDRANVFRTQAQSLIDQSVEGVKSERVRAQIQLQLAQLTAAKFGAISAFAQREFKAESEDSRKFLFEQGRRQLLEADTPDERAAILGTLRSLGAQFVESGAVSQTEISRSLVEAEEGAEVDRMRLLISADPHDSERHLLALARGEDGVEGFPDVPLDEVRTLLEESRGVRRSSDGDSAREEAILDRQEAERQDLAAANFRTQLYSPDSTTEDLRRVTLAANQAVANGDITKEDHNSIIATSRSFQVAIAKGDNPSDPGLVQQFTLNAFGPSLPRGEYEAQRDALIESIEAGDINRKDGAPLLKALNDRIRNDHFSKVPEVQDGIQFISRVVGGSELGFVLSFDDPLREIKQRGALAVQTYNDAMSQIAESGGRDAVQAQARDVAQRIVDTFAIDSKAQLEALPIPKSLRDAQGATVSERYDDAFARATRQPHTKAEIAAELRMLKRREALELEVEKAEAAKRTRTQESLGGPSVFDRTKSFLTNQFKQAFPEQPATPETP